MERRECNQRVCRVTASLGNLWQGGTQGGLLLVCQGTNGNVTRILREGIRNPC